MSNSTAKSAKVSIYVLQRISDKAYLYIGSAKNPSDRFKSHKKTNPYPTIREAFSQDNIRFLVVTITDEEHRIETETRLWKIFKNAGHPIENRNPSLAWTTCGPKVVSMETRRKQSRSHKGRGHTEEAKQKISASKTGKSRGPMNEEWRRKLSQSHRGKPRKPHTEETRKKLSESHKGFVHSEESRAKMSASQKGRVAHNKGKPAYNRGKPHSEETKRKISEAGKGKHPSKETRIKMSRAHKGKPFAEDHKQKLREARLRRANRNTE